jgi:hypothetical protein
MSAKSRLLRAALTGVLLLAGGWGVPALRSASETADADVPKPDFREVYRPEFEKVYRLEKGQVLKRIAPPFIPEREVYYLVEHETQSRHIRTPPDYFTFHFTEEKGLRNWGLGFGNGTRTVASVLENTLGMKSYQYEGPRALLSLDLAGDWVIRPDAPESEKLVALGRIASEAHGRLLHFQSREVERDVIVATGRFEVRPLDGAADKGSVHLFVGKPDSNSGGGGGSGDLPSFLQTLGTRVGVAVIDQTQAPPPMERISWRHDPSAYLTRDPPGPAKDGKVTELLDTLSKQTGLKFERARRKVPVWVVSEGPVAG